MSVYVCRGASGPIDALVEIPGSKSLTNRALIASALADGTSILVRALLAEDTWLMIEALRELGISIAVDEPARTIEVTGGRGFLPASQATLYGGNAGTVIRFCTALCALGQGRYELDGTARMRRRPIGALTDALQRLGCGIEFPDEEGFPPVVVHASGLRGGTLRLSGIESSQYVSALLLVAPYLRGDLYLHVDADVPSLPYVFMTLRLMEAFGAVAIQQAGTGAAQVAGSRPAGIRCIVETPQRYVARKYTIEPDASNATYFLAAPAIVGGRVTVEGLGTDSVQGDAGFAGVLEQMGCRVERHPRRLSVAGPQSGQGLRGIDVDLNAMPDTVMTIAVLALFAAEPTTIRNVANLRVKETDRLAALQRELSKLGASVTEHRDGLTIEPPARITAAEVETYNDHRMAMSFALAGLGCPGLVIRDPECCSKTYPDFFQAYEGLLGTSPG